jgi:hypothetical protein
MLVFLTARKFKRPASATYTDAERAANLGQVRKSGGPHSGPLIVGVTFINKLPARCAEISMGQGSGRCRRRAKKSEIPIDTWIARTTVGG